MPAKPKYHLQPTRITVPPVLTYDYAKLKQEYERSIPLKQQLPPVNYAIPRTIALCGPYESGKTTASAILSMLGYQPLSFGSIVRDELTTAVHKLSRPIVPAGYDADEWYAKAMSKPVQQAWDNVHGLGDYVVIRTLVYEKPTPYDIRLLLQWYGTEYRRIYYSPTYWVDAMYPVYAALLRNGPVVFDDWRFPNEDIWKRHGVKALRIRMEKPEEVLTPTDILTTLNPRDHPSEQSYMKLPVELVIENNNNFGRLCRILRDAITTTAFDEGRNSHLRLSRVKVWLPRTFPPQV